MKLNVRSEFKNVALTNFLLVKPPIKNPRNIIRFFYFKDGCHLRNIFFARKKMAQSTMEALFQQNS